MWETSRVRIRARVAARERAVNAGSDTPRSLADDIVKLVSGSWEEVIATEQTTWGRIKNIYK